MAGSGRKKGVELEVIDLHCDLLGYLGAKEGRHAENREVRCALPQLREGGVALQITAIFSETGKKSVAAAERQFTIFRTLPKLYPEGFAHLKALKMPPTDQKIYLLAAIENASGLCSEREKLENAFTRFDQYREVAGPILYISLTWNHPNRFGGGNQSSIGLKRDGELLLEYLSGTKIAIDLSHTSDPLGHDILNYIDKKGLDLIPIASHSNFRKVANHPRNLPDILAKEIVRRGGIIGLNFVKPFVGKKFPNDFIRQIQYARSLGAFDHFCLGADFFYDKDILASISTLVPFYYEQFSDASCYPTFFETLSETFTTNEIEQLASKNFANYLGRI